MKHLATLLTVLLCCLTFTHLTAHAEYTYDDTLSELFSASGADELTEFLPEEYDLSDPSALTSLSPKDVLHQVWKMFTEELSEPLTTLALLMGVILLSALADSFRGAEDAVGSVYETVCVLCAVGIVSEPVICAFLQSASVLEHTADFTLTYSAVFGSILTVSGGITTAAVYRSSIALLCELAMEAATRLLFPLLSMCLAMSIVDAVNPSISLAGVIRCIQKVAAWILGLLMALFLGLLSIQSMVAVSADRATTKAAKYMISGLVPFIGGAVSDAYTAVLGSMNVLRSGVGMIGILAMASLLLPVLLQLGIYRMLTSVAAAAAELFASSHLTKLFRNMECVLATGFSAAVSFSVMFIFSTAVMMLLGGNVSTG